MMSTLVISAPILEVAVNRQGRDRPAWDGSTRRDRLPEGWEQIRRAVLARDGWRCRIGFADLCVTVATQADHVVAGDDHRLSNLQAACGPCHQRKSSQEGAAARPRLYREPERHPALG
jgi:5-methylcytosine-specific restriction protein A